MDPNDHQSANLTPEPDTPNIGNDPEPALVSHPQRLHVGALLSLLGFIIMAGGVYLSASAHTSGGSNCLSPTSASSFSTQFTRNSGTITVKNGGTLCSNANVVLESFTVPSTWDRTGVDNTSVPQTEFAAVNVTLLGGVAGASKTTTISVPPNCQNTQIDFYFPPAYPAILTLHADSGRIIGGSIFAGVGSCTIPTPTPTWTPTPTPSWSPKPSHSPSPSPSPTPSTTPSTTPSPTPSLSIACSSLRANTTTGVAPLTVTFTGSGTASGQTISTYQFIFGDNNQVTTTSQMVTHTYTTPGAYTATLTLKGSVSGQTSVTQVCSVPVSVGGVTPSPTPSPTPMIGTKILPQTGMTGQLMTLLGALLVTIGLIHVWLTQRKKLITVPNRHNKA